MYIWTQLPAGTTSCTGTDTHPLPPKVVLAELADGPVQRAVLAETGKVALPRLGEALGCSQKMMVTLLALAGRPSCALEASQIRMLKMYRGWVPEF